MAPSYTEGRRSRRPNSFENCVRVRRIGRVCLFLGVGPGLDYIDYPRSGSNRQPQD